MDDIKRKGPDAGQPVPGVESDMTIQQWCAKHNYSLTTFYKLEREGNAPEVIRPPGTNAPRISQRADRAWEKRMQRLRRQTAGQREAERRSKMTATAGRIAAKSPLHVSNRNRRQG